MITTRRWTDRYKRCPKCQARILRTTEFCPHCGLSMPGSFPHGPLVTGDARKAMQDIAEGGVGSPTRGPGMRGRYLVIVARDRRDLYEYLKAAFAYEPGVHVLQERRQAQRRRRSDAPSSDRRRKDRRSRPKVDAHMRTFGFAIVRTC